MNHKSLTLIIISFLPNLTSGQSDYGNEYLISLKALEILKQGDIGSFKSLFQSDIAQDLNDKALTEFVKSSKEILKMHEVPTRESVQLEISKSNYKGKTFEFIRLIFYFPPASKGNFLTDHIMLVFSREIERDKLVGFKIRDFTGAAREREEAAKTKPHLNYFDFKTANLSWFRIWYNKGPVKNKLGGKSGTYALSGGQKMLTDAKIETLLSDIFNLINNAKIDSTDYKYGLVKTKGDPEYLYIRMTFTNYDYKEFNEFSFFTVLTPEEGVDELSDGYVVIKHSDAHRYFISLSDNTSLWDKLKELAHMNHGNLLEYEYN